jgi:hypothetical protein
VSHGPGWWFPVRHWIFDNVGGKGFEWWDGVAPYKVVGPHFEDVVVSGAGADGVFLEELAAAEDSFDLVYEAVLGLHAALALLAVRRNRNLSKKLNKPFRLSSRGQGRFLSRVGCARAAATAR